MGKISRSGSEMNILDHFFRELRKKNFWGIKCLNSLMWMIWDLGIFLNLESVSGMEKIRIRDVYPKSATPIGKTTYLIPEIVVLRLNIRTIDDVPYVHTPVTVLMSYSTKAKK